MCRQASAHCRSSGRESPQSEHGHGGRQSHGVRPLAGIQVLVRKFLPRDVELGDELWTCRGEAAHTDTTVRRLPAATLRCTGQWWWGSPLAGRLTAGRDNTVLGALMNTSLRLVGYSSRLTKGIMVISKYFWSLYKLSLLWWHFLSWNLEPKALSSWSAEDSQIAKYLVMD